MRFVSRLVPIVIAVGVQMAAAQAPDFDTLWMFKDGINDTEKIFYDQGFCDTSEGFNNCFQPVDTGDKFDSSYLNFNYQFTNAHPGYAGFKLYWDGGMTLFNAINYDSLYLVHKGPLSTHKVKVVLRRGTGCGAPTILQNLGEFKSSNVWTKTTIPLPSDSNVFNKAGLFEMRLLIVNDGGTSPTSDPGDFKIDNIGFIKRSTAVVPRMVSHLPAAGNGFFTPTVSGKVVLSIFSLQGAQLFRGTVDVAAGTKYDVGQFARSHSRLPASLIGCVQITGPGVNVTQKIYK